MPRKPRTKYIESEDSATTRDLFEKRNRYQVDVVRKNPKNVVEFNFGEKMFYGRINSHGVPIRPSISSMIVDSKYSKDPTEPQAAYAFVLKAFHMMVEQFSKASAARQIASDDKYLSQLRVHRGYQDSATSYEEYISIYYKSIAKKIRKSQYSDFLNINEFMVAFKSVTENALSEAPFTFPGFVKSKFCGALSSGLALEVADLDYSNDQSKVTEFMRSRNWKYFVKLCNSYGFMIDANIPWRIVADINSDIMISLAQTYGLSPGGYALLSNAYSLAASHTLRRLPTQILELYNTCKKKRVKIVRVCDGQKVVKYYEPKKYTVETLFDDLNGINFLDLYLSLRMSEVKPNLSLNDREMIRRDCLELYSINNSLVRPVVFFENIMGKTFDNLGSVSYYIKVRERARRESAQHGQYRDMPLTFGLYVAGLDPADRDNVRVTIESQDGKYLRGIYDSGGDY